RTAEGLEQTLQALDRTVGLDRVYVVHANDSKTAVGSRVDRHQHIGKGQIGLEAFGRILNHPLLAKCAFILETPIDKPGDDRRNVAALWKLPGREVVANGDGMKPRPKRSGAKNKKKGRSAKKAAKPRKKAKSKPKSKAKSRGKKTWPSPTTEFQV